MGKRYSFDKGNTFEPDTRKSGDKDDWSSWSRRNEDLVQGLLAWDFSGENPAYPQNQFLVDMQYRVQNQRSLTRPQAAKAQEALDDWLRSLTRTQKPDPDAPPHWVDDEELWELAKVFRKAEKKNLDYNHGLPAIYVKLEPLAKEFRAWFQYRFSEEKPMTIASGRRIPEKDRWGWKKSGDWTDVFQHVIYFYFWKIPYEGGPLNLDDFCEREVFSDTLKGLREKGRDRRWLQKHDEECARERREQGREGEIN